MFRSYLPVKVWPPKGLTSTTDIQQLPTRSPGAVRRQPKNYRDFFSQNQLPANFPTYRAPPHLMSKKI